MKPPASVWSIVCAFALGGAAGIATAAGLEDNRKLVFYWEVPRDIVALTHGGQVPIVGFPAEIRSLAGTAAETQLLLGVTLRDEKDEIIGIAAELETFSKPYDERFAHDTVWTLLIPGRGSLVAHEVEESNRETIEFFKSLEKQKTPWHGSFETRSTVGPGNNSMGVVIGGTGEFAGAKGTMIEENHYRAFDFEKKTSDVRNRLTFVLEHAGE